MNCEALIHYPSNLPNPLNCPKRKSLNLHPCNKPGKVYNITRELGCGVVTQTLCSKHMLQLIENDYQLAEIKT